MDNIIAIAGKGGTGKTTLAALIVRVLKEERPDSILAIDADPNSTLGQMLGVKEISTIVDILDDISDNLDKIPEGVTKDRIIEMRVQESLNEEEGFDLLSMGRPEGPGCYCFVNNILRGLIEKLMNNYSCIIVDNEAGMEHLSRRLVRRIDTLFIVSDSSVMGIRAASRISALTRQLNIAVKNEFLILNKSKNASLLPNRHCEPLTSKMSRAKQSQRDASSSEIASSLPSVAPRNDEQLHFGNKLNTLDLLKSEINTCGLNLRAVLPFSEEVEDAAVKMSSIFELSGQNPVLNAVRDVLLYRRGQVL